MQVSPQQVYQEVLNQGGDVTQAQVAAALVDGIESNGDPTELSGGIGPAQGLFQFEPGTWTGSAGGGKGGLPGTVGAASWQQQVTGFLNATRGNNFGAWGPDLVSNRGDPNSSSNPAYGYSGGIQPGSEVANKIASLNLSGSAQPPLDAATAAAYNSDPAVRAYLDAGAAAAGSASSTGDPSSSSSSSPTRTTTINGQTITGTDTQITADEQVQQVLQNYGLGDMSGWAWGEITSGADQNQVVLDLQNTPQFASRFPGIIAQENYNKANPNNPVPVISVDQYLAYETNAMQSAQAAGIPPGIVTHDLIGQLIAGNVSTTEFTQRVNDATALAINSTPEQNQMFNQYFGVQDYGAFSNGHGPLTTGQIAALALDPNIAEPIIKQQILAAQVGGASATAGVSGVSSQEALAIAQSNPGLTQSGIQSAVGQVAPLALLQTGLPGQSGAQSVDADTLIGTQLLPTAQNTRALQVAQETRKAPFSGGGGYVSDAKGAAGTGSSSGTGVGNT